MHNLQYHFVWLTRFARFGVGIVLLGCLMLFGLFGCKQNPPAATTTFRFQVEEVFYIKPPMDRVILVGTVKEGTIRVGGTAVVRTHTGDVAVTVENIETVKDGDIKQATAGQQVGLRLRGITKDQPQRGDLVVAGDAVQAATTQARSPMETSRLKLLRDRIPEMPIIVLVKESDPKSRVLDVQDYTMNGEKVVPLFSSKDALSASLRGTDLGRPTFAITRALLAQVLRGDEVFLLDPQLPSQLRFTAAEFREAFPERFVSPASQAAN